MSTGDATSPSLNSPRTARRLSALLALVSTWGRQLGAYTLVGGLVLLIDLVTYWAIIRYGESWFLYSHFISRTVGGVSCFFLNRYVTFRNQGVGPFMRDLVRFTALYLASFILSSILVYTYVALARLGAVPGKVFAECTVFLFNYTIMKYWVMKPARA